MAISLQKESERKKEKILKIEKERKQIRKRKKTRIKKFKVANDLLEKEVQSLPFSQRTLNGDVKW